MGKLARILRHASTEGRAVVAFNAVDPISMWGVLRGADAAAAPVIVQMSERAAVFWGPAFVAETFASLHRSVATDAVLHLDHSRSPSIIHACLDAGWDSVLVDASALTFDQAVALTREVVARATDVGADVEGEFDPISAVDSAEASPRSDPDECARFVRQTGVACLAPALGTSHGRPRHPPEIDLALTKKISEATAVPLVLHGGTGLSPEQVRDAIRHGVTKINVSTQLKERYLDSCTNMPPGTEPLQLVQRVRDAVESLAREWSGSMR